MLTYTVKGRGLFRAPPHTELYADPGDLVLLRREAPAARGVARGDEWHALWLRFDPWPKWTPEGFDRIAEGLYRRHLTLAGPRQRVQEAWAHVIAGLRGRETARTLALVADADRRSREKDERIQTELLLLHLREIFLIAEQDPLRTSRLDSRIRDALQLISTNPTTPYTVADLAERVGLSSDWFGHLFATQIGVSPKHVLRVVRLRQAAAQLQFTDDPVGVIAERTGFSSIFDLSRQFRREYGISPRTYRQRHHV